MTISKLSHFMSIGISGLERFVEFSRSGSFAVCLEGGDLKNLQNIFHKIKMPSFLHFTMLYIFLLENLLNVNFNFYSKFSLILSGKLP